MNTNPSWAFRHQPLRWNSFPSWLSTAFNEAPPTAKLYRTKRRLGTEQPVMLIWMNRAVLKGVFLLMGFQKISRKALRAIDLLV